MKNSSKRHRWFSFSSKGVLLLTLLVAAYFAGRSHQVQDVDELRFRVGNLEAEKKIVESRVQSAEQEAREWSKRYFLLLDQDELERVQGVGPSSIDAYVRLRRRGLPASEAAVQVKGNAR